MAVVTITRDNRYISTDVYQYDKNRILEIYGLQLSSAPEIHFYNGTTSEALVKQADMDESGTLSAEIPNIFLEKANPIKVFICVYNGEEFISKWAFTVNVKSRPKPADYIAEDDEKIYSYNALENTIVNTVDFLMRDQEAFHEDIQREFEEYKTNILDETQNIINNTTIANSNTLDGYHAEEFTMESKPGRTVFNSDGSISTLYSDGSSEKVVFNADGSITTTRNTLELGVKTETVKINSDGSISVEVG